MTWRVSGEIAAIPAPAFPPTNVAAPPPPYPIPPCISSERCRAGLQRVLHLTRHSSLVLCLSQDFQASFWELEAQFHRGTSSGQRREQGRSKTHCPRTVKAADSHTREGCPARLLAKSLPVGLTCCRGRWCYHSTPAALHCVWARGECPATHHPCLPVREVSHSSDRHDGVATHKGRSRE